ncbi:hypothetical protein PW52_05245 [Tamlana sedimentorum]|uniref:Lipoprotein n=1 Tax=Neotamlana sedimentorum TaxID=1435349 RepID=A0A0D7WAB1_9FLAO|nr:hypothetical protein [Tamlana sedimentorum]KJD36024.1 hypothetical protein PW52_05245 [Tamlana sedimentorum]
MKKLTIFPVLLITLLFTSCIEDIIEDVTELEGPVLAKANVQGYNFVSKLGGGTFTVYQDNSYKLVLSFTDLDDVTDVLRDIHTLGIFIYGQNFNNLSSGISYSELYQIETINEDNLGGFLGVYWTGNLIEDEINYIGASSGVEGSSGTFKITALDTSNKIISGTFNFTTIEEGSTREITINSGEIINIEYDIEYSDIESINIEIEG